MVNKIAKVTIYVNDQQEAKEFWTKKMHFFCSEAPMGPNGTWMEVKPSESEFMSFIIYDKQLMKEQRPDFSVDHPNIMLSTSDVEKTHKELKENGVVVFDIMDMPYGKMFVFEDQDGNAYLIRED